jgi:hypothetical protein
MNYKATIYFGASKDGKIHVLAGDWSRFIDGVVCPRFSGFTITSGTGFWEGVSEPVRILTILGDYSINYCGKIYEIATAYKKRFGQDCVLVEWSNVKGELV